MRILITTLAEYQTVFWRDVGVFLRREGHDVAFISFDDRSTEMLTEASFKVFSGTAEADPADEASASKIFKDYGIEDLNYWFGHERFAYGERDSARMRRKLLATLKVAGEACLVWSKQGPVTMVQELGGFLSVVGSYFAARHHGVKHVFLEPSFFRGRFFVLKDSFSALRVPDDYEGPTPPEVRKYLEDTLREGAIVVPLKDKHHYTPAWQKVLNTHNVRRFVEKMVDKHVHRKKQEFGYVGQQAKTHLRMLQNSWRLRRRYTSLEDCEPFVYYPLHVPGDVALTLRTPHLLDQLALIDYLCRSVPETHRVAVKEHPAMVGAIPADRMKALLTRYDNLALLPPTTNNYAVLRRADAVVSINSKSGAEATLLGKPVVVLGDAFYADSPLVSRIDRLQDVPDAIDKAIHQPSAPDQAAIERYFSAVWARSIPGELYVATEENVARFSESLAGSLASRGP